MPHFIVECSDNVLLKIAPNELMSEIYETALSSELFKKSDIKVRIHTYQHHKIANKTQDFIHIFAHIVEGRTPLQKQKLSHSMVRTLKNLFPEIEVLSMSIQELEKFTYYKKSMV